MEKFDIMYKGKKVEAERREDGNYFVRLPKRYDRNGNEFVETIQRDDRGWRFSASIKEDPEYYFNLWLLDDGRIAYSNDLSDEVKETREKFDPKHKDSNDVLYDLTKRIYEVVEQFYEHEQLGVPASKINELRKIRLATTLKLLGYSSTSEINSELDSTNSYFALGKVGAQLENYINLGAYVHNEGERSGVDTFSINMPNGMTKDKFFKMAQKVTLETAADRDFIRRQDEHKESMISFLDDYCDNMQRKVPYDEWLIYSRVVRQTAELLIELNHDIVDSSNKHGLPNLSMLTGNELADRISRLIDSRDFSRATDIEDRFVIRETKRVGKKVDEFKEALVGRYGSEEEVAKTSLGITLEGLKLEAANTRKKKSDYSAEYNKMEKMYYSKVPEAKDTKEGDEVTQDDD